MVVDPPDDCPLFPDSGLLGGEGGEAGVPKVKPLRTGFKFFWAFKGDLKENHTGN